uniref:TrmE-type G domain-containing protein n=1 Tax=Dendroctonus ponderosae TaxID=77166 RepID=A0AAR5PWT5_DENPD
MLICSNLLRALSRKSKTQILRQNSSTIFALSSVKMFTGLGKCGVAVIRVSGPEAGTAISKLTTLKELPQPRTVVLRSIKHPISNELIDKGLILWLPGPRSFTGEDSSEFHVHGGVAVINGLLDALASMPKFKLAEPGEFTRRAFSNGKLDLTEVEGLADLLQAETEAQRKQALLQADGSLSKLYENWRHVLKHSVANLEAHIDFEETETLEDGLVDNVVKNIEVLSADINKHMRDGRKGEILRRGVKAVILGEPNVGKSSLLNVLCQRPASIVTPISGTTRDVIQVTLNIQGYPLVLSDTAGLRKDSQDVIELEGMSRAVDIYQKADLVILVIDFQNYSNWCHRHAADFKTYILHYIKELGVSDLINDPKDGQTLFKKECVVVLNKTDLDSKAVCDKIHKNIVKLSCKTEAGISDLVTVLAQHLKILCGEPSQEHPSMNQVRHREQLLKCQKHLQSFLEDASKNKPDLVIMAEHLRKALTSLGKLIGTVTSEEILDLIFREFCIGK